MYLLSENEDLAPLIASSIPLHPSLANAYRAIIKKSVICANCNVHFAYELIGR